MLAANRDEYHARPAAPLACDNGRIGGKDLRSGGMWLGVSEAARCAVVVNVTGQGEPDPAKQSRGALVADALDGKPDPKDLQDLNPFSLIVIDRDAARLLTNRPQSQTLPLSPGLHILSNGVAGAPWPRGDAVGIAMQSWLGNSNGAPETLFEMLADERGDQPAFIRNPLYGTRCSTIVAVTSDGIGSITERSFGPDGTPGAEVSMRFAWSR